MPAVSGSIPQDTKPSKYSERKPFSIKQIKGTQHLGIFEIPIDTEKNSILHSSVYYLSPHSVTVHASEEHIILSVL